MSQNTDREQLDIEALETAIVAALKPLEDAALVKRVLGYGGDLGDRDRIVERVRGMLPAALVAWTGTKFRRASQTGSYDADVSFLIDLASDRLETIRGEGRRLGLYEILRHARALLADRLLLGEDTRPSGVGRVHLVGEDIERTDLGFHLYTLEVVVPWRFESVPPREALEDLLRVGASLNPYDVERPFEADNLTPAAPARAGGVFEMTGSQNDGTH
jgi:hypothetical protein